MPPLQHFAQVCIEGEKGRLVLQNPIAPHNGNEIIIEADGSSDSESVAGGQPIITNYGISLPPSMGPSHH